MNDYDVHQNAQVKVYKQHSQPQKRRQDEKDPDVWDPPTPVPGVKKGNN